MTVSHRQRRIPTLLRNLQEIIRTFLLVDADRRYTQPFVLFRLDIVRRPTMVAHHPQHMFSIPREPGEGSQVLRHLCRQSIRFTRQDRRERRGNGSATRRVIRYSHAHEERTEIRIPQSKRPERKAQTCNLTTRELGHENGNFEHDGPESNRMAIGLQRECSLFCVEELQQIDRCKIACRVIEEHVFAAGIARTDRSIRRTCVPVVNRRIVLHARIRTAPGCRINLLPQIPCGERLRRKRFPSLLDGFLKLRTPVQVPLPILLHRFKKPMGDAHGIIGILSRNGLVRLPVVIHFIP